MTITSFATAIVALAVALTPPLALAGEPGANPGNGTVRTIDQRAPLVAPAVPHYEWQYHYGHHAQYEGHWVLVK
jgi:hypothetical protein